MPGADTHKQGSTQTSSSQTQMTQQQRAALESLIDISHEVTDTLTKNNQQGLAQAITNRVQAVKNAFNLQMQSAGSASSNRE